MSESKASLLFDPRNLLCVPNLSGRLIQHGQECDACDGQGHFYDNEGPRGPDDLEGDVCDSCDGEGSFWWPCWYGEDKGDCFYCGEEDVLLAHVYEGSSDSDAQYVCLPCYLKQHKESCGCDKWEWAEKRILGLL